MLSSIESVMGNMLQDLVSSRAPKFVLNKRGNANNTRFVVTVFYWVIKVYSIYHHYIKSDRGIT